MGLVMVISEEEKVVAPIPVRPTLYDKETLVGITTELSLHLKFWFTQATGEAWPKQSKKHLMGILDDQRGWGWDAFQLTKSFESLFKSPGDTELVDIFKNIHGIANTLRVERVKKWVHKNGIIPHLRYGVVVSYERAGQIKVGKIKGVKHATAEYLVNFDKESDYSSSGGKWLACEDVKKLDLAYQEFVGSVCNGKT